MTKLAYLVLVPEPEEQKQEIKKEEDDENKAPKEKELVLEYLRPLQDAEYDKETEEFKKLVENAKKEKEL